MVCDLCSIGLTELNTYKCLKSRCKSCQKAVRREYYKNNRQAECKRKSVYQKENIDKALLWVKKYQKSSPLVKLAALIRQRTRGAIKSKKFLKKSRFKEYLGCSPEQLKKHLELQFKKGMTWENHGMWHIDHIIPLSSAKSEEELYKLCHYTNLQPLYAIENLKKGNRI